ncbi:MAG: aminotransferase class I/II-fold pyridoxal phosphate-dependent enzyme [Nocardioides sp.]|nr:aminotransferase class I/II-fold pyridoxal phosphate-dependent enzyme [Nocardioides sp.]
MSRPIIDLTDDEARAGLVLKWGSIPADVLPAWVAEMDYALDPVITETLMSLVAAGTTGYPAFGDGGIGAAYAGFARRHFGWELPEDNSVVTGDVIAGVRLALETWTDSGPVVVHSPAYPPFFDLPALTGRERVDLDFDPDASRAVMDLGELDRAFASGARTLLLCNPHNPMGRAWTRAELEGVRDVVVAHRAKVIADEIHGPLVLPGSTFTPYLSLPGTSDHAVCVTSASKSFNTAGLHCGHIVSPSPEVLDVFRGVPLPQNHAFSPLGVAAAVAAYTRGDEWLSSLVERIDGQRSVLADALAEHLPEARMRPLEATYLAWVDLRAYGHDDPGGLALERGRVMLGEGRHYHPDLAGHVRINIATSPERLREVVRRLGRAIS